MPAPSPHATVWARRGMVCSVDHLASSAGAAMLRAGGSAVDAAVAASALLAVTTPHMCGMGGDLFALVAEPGGAEPWCLNASGRAGSGADPDRLRAEGRTAMPFKGDIRSATIPGCVDGWVELHTRFGRLALEDVLAPALDAARHGFPASPLLAAAAAGLAEPGELGRPRPGGLVRRPGVARCLQVVAAQGRDGFYRGEFGEGLIELGGGEYCEADLARSQAEWVAPLGLEVWGRRVWTPPPNSQGYLSLAGAWLAERLDLPDTEDDPAWPHLLIEAARHAAFDRPAALHEHADGAALLAPERLGRRLAAISPERAAVLGDTYRGGGTIFLCAVDEERRGVALIQSNASGFGTDVAVPSVGVFLQNRGMGFSLTPGHPAEYGPGRRPPHTLAPAVVTEADGALHSVLGTMGADSQPQIVLQLLARLLGRGGSPGDAVWGPRWVLAAPDSNLFDTWDEPDRAQVVVEPHAPAAWAPGLAARGHAVVSPARWNWGHAHCITVGADGVLAGASDPRALTGGVAAW
ncbi:MAG: gamma-glutamyltransferase family protein [Acidimicrobiales bacterium]